MLESTIPLEHQRPVTAQLYTTVALPQVSKNCEKRAQELDWGASCFTLTMPLHMPPIWQLIFWGGTPVQLLTFTPYSADLAPRWILSIPWGEGPTAWEAVFNIWRSGCSIPRGALCTGWQWLAPVLRVVIRRMWHCIDAQREYFGKM